MTGAEEPGFAIKAIAAYASIHSARASFSGDVQRFDQTEPKPPVPLRFEFTAIDSGDLQIPEPSFIAYKFTSEV